jgi:hypothetical protein
LLLFGIQALPASFSLLIATYCKYFLSTVLNFVRMEDDNFAKKLTFQKAFGSRRKGRPTLRCADDKPKNSGRKRVVKKGIGQRRMEECAGGG